ncbi:MAG: hypothetical protein VR73_15050 [Gammaproteobacteria bacterium BRH_c0]|nr:MAG: hypothetical protein VR73_15050 [Gammaproteobacteria bacterium BRH_c0]
MSGISADIINILHAEVETLVDEIADFLFNEPLERQPMECKVDDLRGICRLLELPAAVSLLGELSKTVATITDKGGSPLSHQPELAAILDIFPRIFKVLSRIRRPIPFLFMPELAILRRLQGLPPLYEFQLLGSHHWPESSRFQGATTLTADALAAVKKLKQLYQMGLLDILRGSNQRKGAEVVAKVAGRLKLIFSSTAEQYYWSLVECVARALERGSLDFNPVRMRLLAAVERQLKSLLDGPGQKSAYPLGLWRAFAILLAMVEDKDETSLAVCEWVGAPDFDYTDRDISTARAIIFEGETDNLDPFLTEVNTILGSLHSLLELMDSKGDLSADEAAAFAVQVSDMAELCTQQGLLKASSRFHGHHLDILQTSDNWQQSSELLKAIAHSILYVECLMLHVREQGYAIQGLLQKLDLREVDSVIEEKLVDSSISAVWSECLRKLGAAKELIDDIATERAGDEVGDNLAREFDEIRGAAVIIGDSQAEDIAGRCGQFVRRKLFNGVAENQDASLSSFADAVVALEYYFQNSRNGEKSDFVLAIADEYLAELEA